MRIQHGKQEHDADFDAPLGHGLTVGPIVLPERIVQDICEVDEDRVERDLALDGAQFLPERRGADFMVVYVGLQLLEDL
jgi:hypothetical protein